MQASNAQQHPIQCTAKIGFSKRIARGHPKAEFNNPRISCAALFGVPFAKTACFDCGGVFVYIRKRTGSLLMNFKVSGAIETAMSGWHHKLNERP